MPTKKQRSSFIDMVGILQRRLDCSRSPKFFNHKDLANCYYNDKTLDIHPRYGYKHKICVYYGYNFKGMVLPPTKLAKWIIKTN